MKKIILGLACITTFSVSMAQNKNVVSAINYLNDYKKSQSLDDLLEAKKFIDEAAANEETKSKPKTWVKRGEVYTALFLSKEDKVKSLGINILDELYNSYQQVIANTPDKKGEYYEVAKDGLRMCAGNYFNDAGKEYTNKDFTKALAGFEKSITINKDLLQKVDTFGIYYAGLCANEAGNTAKAKEYFSEAIKIKYGSAYKEADAINPYIFLARAYKAEKNDAEYLNALKTAKAAFPNNKELILEEMNFYIGAGRLAEAAKNVDEAIAKDPTNKVLYMNKGIMYDNLANPKEGKVDAKLYEEYLSKALEATNKAVELDPNYFDALFQLGALYFNKGVKQTEFANTITGMSAAEVKRYEAETKKADVFFKQALPHFEKCDAIGSTDKSVLKDLYSSLKQIYTFTEQPEKSKAMKVKMDQL
jgi:tetratricopeptide (TPR) repeat protein